ncbi:MAG: SAVED domain-containing protein [Gemmatimonadetes bacterium]|nr:SAVED domain-containing protein [Gemmatimonadota bacterium]MBK7352154.1 SAVED domain-containing protein [Gemmatimonadota bacterium]MBK7784809.1 SAVED domain-containing protein [Gemmatimonadota bacterium]
MAREVKSRSVGLKVERELWARAAGRCQFDGCNRPLFKSPVTQERVNISEKAHIYSFSKDGPRGWSNFFKGRRVNDISNLMLVCHDCHKTIDQDQEGTRYSAELLRTWKEDHERRIAVVTGVDPSKKSHVVLYGANIGGQTSPLNPEAAKLALFPEWYPADEQVVSLSMKWEGRDRDDSFWVTEAANLVQAFNRHLVPLIGGSASTHISVFGFAPMPLLTLFGSLITDKVAAEVYQLHREPYQTWQWLEGPLDFDFDIKAPSDVDGQPVLVISLSAPIAHDRVTAVLGSKVSIWELTIASPSNDFLKSRSQLSRFRESVRRVMVDIAKIHGIGTPLAIFPAMPVACAVELGRVRMPKADSVWAVYDHSNEANRFLKVITIGEQA